MIDPAAGSGTTLDVARDLDRRALGYDVHPTRKDIFRVDARKLPPELTGKADFVFIDPPYSTHLDYGHDPRDIGKLDAAGGEYYEAMEQVIRGIHRVLKPDRHMALYVSDSFVKGKAFTRSALSCSAGCKRCLSRSISLPSSGTTRRWRWATIARPPRKEISSCGGSITCLFSGSLYRGTEKHRGPGTDWSGHKHLLETIGGRSSRFGSSHFTGCAGHTMSDGFKARSRFRDLASPSVIRGAIFEK